MRRALLATAIVMVAIPAAAVAAATWFVDSDGFKARVVAQAERATGRQVTVAGPIRLAWSLVPKITLRDVSLANPPGFSRPQMGQIGQLDARVKLWPLLAHRVEVERIDVVDPAVRLEQDAQGRPNWVFTTAPGSGTTTGSQAGGHDRFAVQVGQVQIVRGTFGWVGAPDLTVSVPQLGYAPASGAVSGVVLANGVNLTVGGTVAAPGAGPIDLRVTSDDGGALRLQEDAGASGTLHLSGQVPALNRYASLSDRLPPLTNLSVSATIDRGADVVTLPDLAVRSDQGDVSGSLRYRLAPRPTLTGTLSAQRLVLVGLVPPPAPAGAAPAAPAVGSEPAAGSRRPAVIPDTALPFAALRLLDADLQLSVGAVVLGRHTLPPLSAHLALHDGTLTLDPISVTVGEQRVLGHASMAAQNHSVSLSLAGAGLPAGTMMALAGGPATPDGHVDLQIDLHGQGGTVRAQADSLTGMAGVALVEAEMPNAWLQQLFVNAKLPIDMAGTSKIRCAAVRVDAQSGQVAVRTLALDTSQLVVSGSGQIDLPAETLDLHLSPRLKGGIGLDVPFRLTGSLAQPRLALDRGAIAPDRVGVLLGGAAPDVCPAALALARDQETPAAAPERPDKPVKPADLLRRLMR